MRDVQSNCTPEAILSGLTEKVCHTFAKTFIFFIIPSQNEPRLRRLIYEALFCISLLVTNSMRHHFTFLSPKKIQLAISKTSYKYLTNKKEGKITAWFRSYEHNHCIFFLIIDTIKIVPINSRSLGQNCILHRMRSFFYIEFSLRQDVSEPAVYLM